MCNKVFFKLFFGSCLSRRYDGNPYSKLRERNKRDVVEEEEKGIEIGETLEIGDAEEFENRNKREVGESGEINKREVGEWRGQITRAPYVRTGQDQVKHFYSFLNYLFNSK